MVTNTKNCFYTRPVLCALCISPHLTAISNKIGTMFLVHSRYFYLSRKVLLLFQTLGTPPLGLDSPRATYLGNTVASSSGDPIFNPLGPLANPRKDTGDD